MAARVWPQFLLYRLRLGRSDAFHLSWPAFGLVLPQHHLAGIVWLLFVYDMRLIQARLNESHGAVERALYTHARWRSVAEHFCAGPLALFQSRLHAGHLPRTKFFRQSRRTRLVDQRSIDVVYYLSGLRHPLFCSNCAARVAKQGSRITPSLFVLRRKFRLVEVGPSVEIKQNKSDSENWPEQ